MAALSEISKHLLKERASQRNAVVVSLPDGTIQHKPDSSGNPGMQRSGMRSWNGEQEQTLIIVLALLFKCTIR